MNLIKTRERRMCVSSLPGRIVSPPEINTIDAEFSTSRLSSRMFGLGPSARTVMAYGTPLKWLSDTS